METFLKIEDIELWARVGVLDEERELGQLFSLDIFLWTDFENCTRNDDIQKTVDYSKLVEILKDQSKKIYCFTIEKYSNAILEIIDKEFKYSENKFSKKDTIELERSLNFFNSRFSADGVNINKINDKVLMLH